MELPQELSKAHEIIKALQDELQKKNDISKDFQKFRKLSEEEKQKLTDSERLLQEQIENMQAEFQSLQQQKADLEKRYETDRRTQIETYREKRLKDIAKGDEKFYERLKAEYDVLNLADDSETAIDARVDRAYQAANRVDRDELSRINTVATPPSIDAESIKASMSPEANAVYAQMFGENK